MWAKAHHFQPSNCEERFLPPSNFGLWATIRQKLFKTSIFERKNWTKKTALANSTIGDLYAVNDVCVCAILVYQSVGKGSSFSTIQVWVCSLFSLLNLRLWATVRQKLFKTSIFEKENWTKRGSPSKFHIWGSLYMQYMLCVCVCHLCVVKPPGIYILSISWEWIRGVPSLRMSKSPLMVRLPKKNLRWHKWALLSLPSYGNLIYLGYVPGVCWNFLWLNLYSCTGTGLHWDPHNELKLGVNAFFNITKKDHQTNLIYLI